MPLDPRTAIVAGLPALALGGALGAVLTDAWREPMRTSVEVLVMPTDDQWRIRCEEMVPEGTEARLKGAVAEIARLEGEIESKEAALTQLERTVGKTAADAAAFEQQRATLKAEVRALRKALDVVAVERDALVVELKQTIEALDAQVVATETERVAKEQWKRVSTDNAYTGFVARTQITMCDRGTAKRQGKCEEVVADALDRLVADRFVACVNSGQAVPSVLQLSRPDDPIPAAAVRLPDDRSVPGRGWYVQLCDPALPEADGLADLPDDPTPEPTTLDDALDAALDALGD